MAFSHEEIVEHIASEIETLSIACEARAKPKKHLEQDDDDYLFIDDNLDRWGDRKVPKDQFDA